MIKNNYYCTTTIHKKSSKESNFYCSFKCDNETDVLLYSKSIQQGGSILPD